MLGFLSRMKNGIVMTGISINYMFKKPFLFFFPILRIILFTVIYAIFIGLFFIPFPRQSLKELSASWSKNYMVAMTFVLGIVVLYFFFFIMLFSSIATIHYVCSLFQNEKHSIRSSLLVAIKRIPTILLWSGIHTGIRIIINIVRGDSKKSSGWRTWLANTMELSWAIATYFVPPIIANKRASVRDTIKESAQLMKQRFGEVAGVAVSFNLLAALIFPGIILMLMGIMNYLYDSGTSEKYAIDFYKYPHALYILLFTGIITLIIRVFISNGQDIFKTAAYNYAHEKPTGPFTPQLIEENFEKKE